MARLSLDSRNELAVEHRGIVRFVAWDLLRRRQVPPHWDFDELDGFGAVALLQALEKYQPDRGAILPFLRSSVRHGILDQIRTRDHSRTKKARPLHFEQLTAVLPEYPEIERRVLVHQVLETIDTLPPRLRRMMLLYYRDGKTMAECGALMGVQAPRISQMHKKAIRKLREVLGVVG